MLDLWHVGINNLTSLTRKQLSKLFMSTFMGGWLEWGLMFLSETVFIDRQLTTHISMQVILVQDDMIFLCALEKVNQYWQVS